MTKHTFETFCLPCFLNFQLKDIDFVFGYECEVKYLFKKIYIPQLKEVRGDGFRIVIFQCT
jgi:hypothetical protein